MTNKEYIIDVDQIITSYNEKNQGEPKMTRKILAKKVGVNPQIFSDWKRGKTPKLVYTLMEFMNIGSCGVDRFIIEKK